MALLNTPNFLQKIFSGGAATVVEAIGSAIDKNVTNKEEREKLKIEMVQEVNRNVEKMTELGNQELELYLKDSASAREANARIQESDKASYLAKNVAYFIDIFFIIVFAIMLVMILFKTVPEQNKELFYTAFGALTAYVSQIINFHRGTSIGSKNSGDALRKIAQGKN